MNPARPMLAKRLLTALLCAITALHSPAAAAAPAPTQAAYLRALATLHPIDAHTHIWTTDPAFTAMLERWNLHVLDILYVDDKQASALPLDQQRAAAFTFVHAAHGHASLCTTFDPFRFSQPEFQKQAIAGLDSDFAEGAIAVKVWKNVGMELKDASGRYVMVDDPRLEPIYRDIEAHGKTLLTHQAEPDVAWGPPDAKALDSSYYATHPEWNMQKIAGAPAKQTILDSRDRLVARHPHLRIVGVHLGSMEARLDMIAARLDRYPNFAIDTGARVAHLTILPSEKVRAFLIKYQDRVLYGTDLEFTKADRPAEIVSEWEKQLAIDWRYFSTADTFSYNGRMVHGVNLPPAVLAKLYHANAVHWLPGIDAAN